jgi:hypothetical protein
LELPDVQKAIGPAASIILAAWIFMGFLQQRYDAAVSRYRQAINDFRFGNHASDRRDNIRDQIFAVRCPARFARPSKLVRPDRSAKFWNVFVHRGLVFATQSCCKAEGSRFQRPA